MPPPSGQPRKRKKKLVISKKSDIVEDMLKKHTFQSGGMGDQWISHYHGFAYSYRSSMVFFGPMAGIGFLRGLSVLLRRDGNEHHAWLSSSVFAQSVQGELAGAVVRFVVCRQLSLKIPHCGGSSEHRKHHKHADTDDDPYDISKGFFWAHIGWLMFKLKPGTSRQRQGSPKRQVGHDPAQVGSL